MSTASSTLDPPVRFADQRARMAVAALLLLAAALFGAGTIIERVNENEPRGDAASQAEEADHGAGEAGGGVEHAEGDESGHRQPTLLGVNLESPVLIGLGVLMSIAAAAAVVRSDAIPVLGAVALFSAAFGVLDFMEALRQGEDHLGLLTVAAVAGLAHATAALIMLRTLAARR